MGELVWVIVCIPWIVRYLIVWYCPLLRGIGKRRGGHGVLGHYEFFCDAFLSRKRVHAPRGQKVQEIHPSQNSLQNAVNLVFKTYGN